MNKLTDFAKGLIIGFCIGLVIFGVTAGLMYRHNKQKEKIEYAKKQEVIEVLREDYVNRDPADFLETVPDVRRAADGAAADFERKRDEAVQRFRSGLVD